MDRRTFGVLSCAAVTLAACAAGADEPFQTTRADPPAFEVTKTDAEWRRILTKEQYEVLRKDGTEPRRRPLHPVCAETPGRPA